ncbi:hypothetical protein D9619_013055 [Psilocybe cf. subviscida]|uniref:Uncharacterized protein n=1 Tax=Psilocybe cf. subviscida TaxID=2480587 RepID=A0A8H5AZQ7_9AGAR|nr:hypothetical protein D9619_013055 [Psilocybe cf. subviscida]
MVLCANLLSCAIFVACAVATPTYAAATTPELESREPDADYRCVNNAVPGGAFVITQANAVAALNGSPRTTGRSGYPHTFENFSGITWPVAKCNTASLLEFPVLLDGKIYNADSRPKDNPGPARIIFTIDGQPAPTKLMCGVVAHAGQDGNPNAGFLNKCT